VAALGFGAALVILVVCACSGSAPVGRASSGGQAQPAANGAAQPASGADAASAAQSGAARQPTVPAQASAAPAAAQQPSAAGQQLTFVMVPKGVHPYFEPAYRGFQDAAKKYGVQVEMDAPPKFDVQLQVKVIEDLIARGVGGIAISADDDAGLVKVVHDAMAAGIKVITFDAPAPSTESLTYIGTDNESAGYQAGKRMAAAMGGKGELAILQGGLEATNLNLRARGFKRALAEFAPQINVVALVDEGGDFSESVVKTESLLAQYPHLRGIFSVSAEGAPAAALVIKQHGLAGRIVIAGFDDLSDTLVGVRDGSIAFCIVQRTYQMGYLSVVELMDAVHDKPVPKFIDTGVVFVDQSNLATYRSEVGDDDGAE
jgi:ribose transport system substrate-binding protein